MNYVVSLVGSLRIDPTIQPTAVRMLNDHFKEVGLLGAPPDIWFRIRLRVAQDGSRLVLDEEPEAPDIEGWGEYYWIAEQLAYVVAAVATLESTISGSLHRRGDHRDDVFVLRIKGEEVYEHPVSYTTTGKLIPVPDERMLLADGNWHVIDGDE